VPGKQRAEEVVADEVRSYAYAVGALQFRALALNEVVQRPN
jgi:hypothetical protein